MDLAFNSVLRSPETEMINRKKNEAVTAVSFYFCCKVYARALYPIQGARSSGSLV